MGHVTIPNVEDTVIDALRSQADRNGRTLEDELRDIVTRAVHRPYTPAERRARSDALRAMTPPGPHPLAEDLIREDRDTR